MFCNNSCKTTYKNLHDNPSKKNDARKKISEFAKARGTALMMTPEARAKAIPKIGDALRGKPISEEAKRNIGIGVRKAGCVPPRNTHLVGAKHPNWKGGTSTIRNKLFQQPEYIWWRNFIYERDNWTCQDCGSRERLKAHHIKSWAEHVDLRYNVDNGVTVCHKCHCIRHRNIPRPITVGPRTLSDLALSLSEA